MICLQDFEILESKNDCAPSPIDPLPSWRKYIHSRTPRVVARSKFFIDCLYAAEEFMMLCKLALLSLLAIAAGSNTPSSNSYRSVVYFGNWYVCLEETELD